MNIYLLTQNESRGYATYDSCVVSAETEEEARKINPAGDWDPEYCYSSWCKTPESVSVKLIGTAIKEIKSEVILASFNAS